MHRQMMRVRCSSVCSHRWNSSATSLASTIHPRRPGPGRCPPSLHGGRMLLPDPSNAALGVHHALGAEQVGELGGAVAIRGGRY
jgi:hypothetical protein